MTTKKAVSNLYLVAFFLVLCSCNQEAIKLEHVKNVDPPANPPSANPPITPVLEDNVRIFGQVNMYNDVPYNNHPTQNTVMYPSSILKVGDYYYLSDTGNSRVLIFKDTLSGPAVGVIGQKNFNATTENRGIGIDSKGMNWPYQLASDGTKLLVTDRYNSRVLIWNTLPKGINEPADVVIGQSGFTTGEANQGLGAPTASTLNEPRGVLYAGGKLYIADFANSRVLIFNSIPTTNNKAADAVIGQADFISNTAYGADGIAGTNDFSKPVSLTYDGTKLYIADSTADRVLVWNTLPAGNTPADVVIGQANFTTGAGGSPTQSKLDGPVSVAVNGSEVYISDYNNSRIVMYDSLPVSGPAGNAAGVIGQANFTSKGPNRGVYLDLPTALSLSYPMGVYYEDSNLIVSDSYNNRILKYPSGLSLTDMGTTPPESILLGQSSYTTYDFNQSEAPNAKGVSNPRSIAITDKYMLTTDQNSNRVLVFNKHATSNAPAAIAVIGQQDFTSLSANQGGANPTASTLKLSEGGIAVDSSGNLYVVDGGNNRVLVYDSIPTTNNVAAKFVIGQAAFTTATAGTTRKTLKNPHSVYAKGNQLFVTDMGNHRVLVYGLPISANQPDADLVIGQPDFITGTSGLSSTKMNAPWGVYAGEDGKLYVNSYGNNRVLVYNSIPTSDGAAADIVLGQANDTSNVNNVTTQSTFRQNLHSTVNAEMNGYILVPDPYGLRIMAFKIDGMTTGMNATYHWGQNDFTSYIYHLLGTADGSFFNFAGVSGIVNDPYDDYIWTVERYTHRILRIKKDHFWSRKLSI